MINVQEAVRTRAYFLSLQNPRNTPDQNWREAQDDLNVCHDQISWAAFEAARWRRQSGLSDEPVAIWLMSEQLLLYSGLRRFRN